MKFWRKQLSVNYKSFIVVLKNKNSQPVYQPFPNGNFVSKTLKYHKLFLQFILESKYARELDSSATVVAHLPHHPKVVGLCPVVDGEKCREKNKLDDSVLV